MKILSISLALVAMTFAAPVAVYAADGGTVEPMKMDCCNTTDPVCGKPVDKAIPPVACKPTADTKAKHPEMMGANVGFCSNVCRTTYEKDPSKYEETLFPQWQQWKSKQVK